METDDKGQLPINLKPGPYALFVTAAGFKKAAQHIDIGTPEGKAGVGQVVPVVLRIGDVSPTFAVADGFRFFCPDFYC